MRRILILHTSVGHGIKVTAENIFAELEENPGLELKIADLQHVEGGVFVSLLKWLYLLFTETFPSIWGFLHGSRMVMAILLPLRSVVAFFKSHKVRKILEDYNPDIVISTQVAPTGIVAYLKSKGLYHGKLISVFSDYYLHVFWLFDEVDLYFCVTSEQAQELKKLEVPENRIALTGMIIGKKYLEEISKKQALAQFGLTDSTPVVLLSGGARGLLSSKEIVVSLLRSNTQFQIVVVAGKNETLKKNLEAIVGGPKHQVKILGYIPNQDVLMSAADILITKAGGPTIAEAVAKRLPIILTNVHPGHEKENLKYLTTNNIVQYAADSSEALPLVERILAADLSFNEAAINKIIEPHGAVSVSEAIEKLLN